MPIKKHWLKTRLIFLTLFTLGLSACVTIQNRHPCSANGILTLGSTCGATLTDTTNQITMDESLDIIEARDVRPDPSPSASPGAMLPAHPAGVFQSAADYGEESTELQEACRDLGTRCSYALKQLIDQRGQTLERIKKSQDILLP